MRKIIFTILTKYSFKRKSKETDEASDAAEAKNASLDDGGSNNITRPAVVLSVATGSFEKDKQGMHFEASSIIKNVLKLCT